MGTFYLRVKKDGKWVQYPEQDGEAALAMMEFLLSRGMESKAICQMNGLSEVFNINEMREMVEVCV